MRRTSLFTTFAALALTVFVSPELAAQRRRAAGPGPGPAPAPDTSITHFATASNCISCHDGMRTTSGEDLSLVSQWQRSLMRHAFVDPFWQAKVRSETIRIPALAAFIEDKCVTCHAPMAYTEAKKRGQQARIFGDGFANPAHPYHAIAMEGVGCTLCHQIQNTADLGTPAATSGHFSIADAASVDGRRIYGQYTDPFTRPMIGAVDYLAVYGSHMDTSAVCATCHDLETDYVNEAGQVVSTPETRFPEQMPYSEWLHSDFAPAGRTYTPCQRCHMTSAGNAQIAWRPPWLPVRSNVAPHQFRTENATMIRILDTFSEELGVPGTDLDQAMEENAEYLATAADLEPVTASLKDGVLTATIRVINNTAHKLPTSLPARRVYLHATIRDASGTVVFESGGLAADGSIIGVDADVDLLNCESHHDVITSPEQVQVYEAIMQTVETDVTYTFLRAAAFRKDNRIPPRGFDIASVPAKIKPAGACLTDANFTGGSDEVTYRVSNLRGERFTMVVELRDQPISYAVVRDLRTNAADAYVARFLRMYETVPVRTEILAEATFTVTR